ncbi:MAG: sensor histidine kinase [Acidobacteriota bacterium]|nr:sensor histidine kinase [Acidobacteriota bacterium]
MRQSGDSVSPKQLQRLLLLGLCVSALLLLSALLVALRTVHQINQNTQLFTNRQALAKASIDDIERQQAELNASWLKLAHRGDVVKREEILSQLLQARGQMSLALESAYEQAEFLRESIYQEGHGLLRWTVWLFCCCVGLSLLCATWVVRASASLFKRLEGQASELTQLQYQFLETQENVARRFSHELHDELGQSLAAVKANLSALRGACTDETRVDDCMTLVDGSIKNVREMSQLLRPTILDDFGLDAALRSLTENFAQRTGIGVSYRSDLNGQRLRDQTETHLFRIAQEALTNVARHSEAKSAAVDLNRHGQKVTLTIRDDGNGFEMMKRRQSQGLGLAGMQTRARGCGGTLKISAANGKGVEIEVACPIGR